METTPQRWMEIGTRVVYHPILGRSTVHDRFTTIRSAPWQLGSGDWVIKVDGVAGGVSVAAIEPVVTEKSKTRRKHPPNMKYSVTLNGEEMSLYAACEKMGVVYATVARKLGRGLTLEEAMKREPVGRKPKYLVDIGGGEMVSLRYACDKFFLDYPSALMRMKHGAPWR